MPGYFSQIAERSGGAPTSLGRRMARPAIRSRSPIAEFDQRVLVDDAGETRPAVVADLGGEVENVLERSAVGESIRKARSTDRPVPGHRVVEASRFTARAGTSESPPLRPRPATSVAGNPNSPSQAVSERPTSNVGGMQTVREASRQAERSTSSQRKESAHRDSASPSARNGPTARGRGRETPHEPEVATPAAVSAEPRRHASSPRDTTAPDQDATSAQGRSAPNLEPPKRPPDANTAEPPSTAIPTTKPVVSDHSDAADADDLRRESHRTPRTTDSVSALPPAPEAPRSSGPRVVIDRLDIEIVPPPPPQRRERRPEHGTRPRSRGPVSQIGPLSDPMAANRALSLKFSR